MDQVFEEAVQEAAAARYQGRRTASGAMRVPHELRQAFVQGATWKKEWDEDMVREVRTLTPAQVFQAQQIASVQTNPVTRDYAFLAVLGLVVMPDAE